MGKPAGRFLILGLALVLAAAARSPAEEGRGREPDASFAQTLSAARKGDAKAQLAAAEAYLQGRGVERNAVRAAAWFAAASKQGLSAAQVRLAQCYARGEGVLQNVPRALALYAEAEKQGGPEDLFEIAGAYRWRWHGIGEDWAKAASYYRRAADLGHAQAQLALGLFYECGVGVPKDIVQAAQWFAKAAEQGDGRALLGLGRCYGKGIGGAPDVAKAVECYKKAMARGGWWATTGQKAIEHLTGKPELADPDAWLQAYPLAEGVEVTLVPEKATFEIGEPLRISIVYKNLGKDTYGVTEEDCGRFKVLFSVFDASGRRLPRTYEEGEMAVRDIRVSLHELRPGGQVAINGVLNESVAIDRPGVYTVTHAGRVCLGGDWHREGAARRHKPASTTVTARDFDKARRARDIERLIVAFQRHERITPELPHHQYLVDELKGIGIIRLLAFFNDPSLIPFFLDIVEGSDVNSYGSNGLAGMKDRAAVLRAFEERLAHPEKHNTTKLVYLYERLAAGRNREDGSLARWKEQEAVFRKYRTEALKLLKSDTTYRYAYLVPQMLSGPDDLFLVDYLLRGKPTRDMLQQSAHVIRRVKLGPEHVPLLEALLVFRPDSTISDAVFSQLFRLDRERVLSILKVEKGAPEAGYTSEAFGSLPEEPPQP